MLITNNENPLPDQQKQSQKSCRYAMKQSSNQSTVWICTVILFTSCIGTTNGCRGGTLIRTGVAPEEKFQILDTHNRLRSSVAQGRVPNQPSAENMQEMVWDDELAQKAQQWANQCTFQHDPSRYLDRFTMGQNLAIIWSTIPLADDDGDFPSRIQNWFNEVQKYAWGAQWSPATGHYSQLVWGDTNLIGCGFSYYKDARRYNKLWVCNYGPGGNVVGSTPYEVGRPACSNYGMIPSQRYSGLCLNYPTTGVGGAVAAYNPKNNFITQNTYTFKTERFNPPTYQVQDKIKNVFNQVFPAAQSTASNFHQPDYPSLKSVLNNVRSVVLNTIKPEPPTYQQLQQTANYNNYQPLPEVSASASASYEQQAAQSSYNVQSQTPPSSVYLASPTPASQSYQQQQSQQSYQQLATPQQTWKYQKPSAQYHLSPANVANKQRSPDDARKTAFLTYDWSQLFSPNIRLRN